MAIGAFGVYFGVLARSVGMSPWAAIVMSGTTFAGSAQFAAVSVLEAGGSPLVAVVAGAFLNARYALMGLSAAPALGGSSWSRLLSAQAVVDESWAVAQRADGTVDRGRLLGAAAVLYVVHVGATAIGALGLGSSIDPVALGLDAAFPALFLALLWPLLGRPEALRVAGLAAALVVILTPLLPAGVPIVLAAGAALLGWRSQ
ncbi:MAG: AzlC family ABC transporter permease [Actinomycetota bacterium]|nr:AzlC family ABC transporter permease [Actinomycetota bacterium]